MDAATIGIIDGSVGQIQVNVVKHIKELELELGFSFFCYAEVLE